MKVGDKITCVFCLPPSEPAPALWRGVVVGQLGFGPEEVQLGFGPPGGRFEIEIAIPCAWEGLRWIRGHFDESSDEGKALLATWALWC